jgi:hypothetical protein
MKIFGMTALALAFLGACAPAPRTALVPTDYRAWKRSTGQELNYPIPGHADNYRRIFMNSVGENPRMETVNGRTIWTYPEGAQIVKEVFKGQSPAAGEKPVTLTVMLKAPRDRDARGGWLWISKNAASGEETVIAEEFCITCHANANEKHPYSDGNQQEEFRDYVFFPYNLRNEGN